MNIPVEFEEHMRQLIGDEYDLLEKSLEASRSYGLRFNPLKVDLKQELYDKYKPVLGLMDPVPWTREGYYYDHDYRPGRMVCHEAGAIYIQEPSAMVVADMLDPKPYERICDLCAAPGGKTSHIAGRMDGKGLLIANEIIPDRARILARNVERMGISNCIVTNENPQSFCARFAGFFHKVVVDAPCSGEGMFRKEEAATTEWSLDNVQMCADRQREIIDEAAKLVVPGGVLVYSTCTFEPAEDEELIASFLENHPEWYIEQVDHMDVLDSGRPSLMENPNLDLEKAVRLWPHKQRGEGHFAVKLVRRGQYDISHEYKLAENAKIRSKNVEIYAKTSKYLHTEILSDMFWEHFDMDSKAIEGLMTLYGESVFVLPKGIKEEMLRGVKCVRMGLHVVDINKNILKPAHSLAMALRPEYAKYSIEISESDSKKYLRGETIQVSTDIPSGVYVLLYNDNISLGWAKNVNGTLKNHYPKGLRRDLD